MNIKQILHISDHYATLYVIRGNNVNRIACFHKPEALDEFVNSLNIHTSPLDIVLGFGNEAFDLKKFPHVNASDRKIILNRHLDKTFPDSHYRNTRFQDRDSEGRKDDNFLIFGIGNNDVVDRWLNVLHKHQVAIRNIHSLPILAEQLAEKLETQSNLLLIGYSSHNHAQRVGIHLHFFVDGKLKISRLHYHFKGDDEAFFKGNALEVKRTIEYIYANRFVQHGKPMEVITISPTSWLDSLSANDTNEKGLIHQYLFANEIARDIGIENPSDEIDFPEIISSICAHKNQSGHYKSKKNSLYYRHAKMNSGLKVASLLIGVSTFAASAFTLYETNSAQNQISTFESLLPAYRNELNALDLEIAPFPVKAKEMEQLVTSYDTLKKNVMSPDDLISDVSPILSNFSQTNLVKLTWDTFYQVEPADTTGIATGLVYEAEGVTDNSPVINTDTKTESSNLFKRNISVEAQITEHGKGMKKLVNHIEQIKTFSINQSTISTANLSKAPLELGSDDNTTGSMKHHNSDDYPNFILELTLER